MDQDQIDNEPWSYNEKSKPTLCQILILIFEWCGNNVLTEREHEQAVSKLQYKTLQLLNWNPCCFKTWLCEILTRARALEHPVPSRSSPLSETFMTRQKMSNTFRLMQAFALHPPTSQLVHHRDNLWTFNALKTFSKD